MSDLSLHLGEYPMCEQFDVKILSHSILQRVEGCALSKSQDSAGSKPYRLCKLRRTNDCRPAAPTKYPTLDFGQARKLHSQFDPAIGQFRKLLRIMPLFFPDIISHLFVEPDDDFKAPLA